MHTRIFILALLFVVNTGVAQYDSIQTGANSRTYLLHLPDGFSSDSIYPLVIAMHGGFGSGTQMESSTELSDKADEEGFIVVYPEGTEGFLNIRTWNAGGCCGYSQDNYIDDVAFIDALLDSLISDYPIDENRVYATGMSNGGMMAYRLACELSDRIAAIAPVASTMVYAECAMENDIPIIHFHSYLDSNVPLEGGIGDGFSDHYNPPIDSVMNVWADFSTCAISNDTLFDTEYFRHIQWSDCNCTLTFDLYLTHDGGHSWPGGNQTLVGDPPSQYISANTLMWEFFEQFTLDCNETLAINEKENSKKMVKVYPNPSKGSFIIVGKKIKKVTIYDLQGKVYMNMDFHPSDMINFDLTGKESGYYFIRVGYGDQEEEMIRFLLE